MAGRGKKKIITKEVMAEAERMAGLNCQDGTIATALGWHVNFIKERKDILKRLRKKRAEFKIDLREAQKNQTNTPAMAIFLGKNYLGQADKQEVDQTITLKVIDYSKI